MDFFVSIRRRDMLDRECLSCQKAKPVEAAGNTVKCVYCGVRYRRWLTKAEIIEVLPREEPIEAAVSEAKG